MPIGNTHMGAHVETVLIITTGSVILDVGTYHAQSRCLVAEDCNGFI